MNCACERFTRQASNWPARLRRDSPLPAAAAARDVCGAWHGNQRPRSPSPSCSLPRNSSSCFIFLFPPRFPLFEVPPPVSLPGSGARFAHAGRKGGGPRKGGRGGRVLLLKPTWINNSVTFTTHYFPDSSASSTRRSRYRHCSLRHDGLFLFRSSDAKNGDLT